MTVLKLGGSKLSKKILSKISKELNDSMKKNDSTELLLDVTYAQIDIRKGKVKVSVSASAEMPVKQAFKIRKGS